MSGWKLASALLIALLKEVEGLSLKPYPDSGGEMTVGYGHLIRPHEEVRAITPQEAERYLVKDAEEALDAVSNLVKMPLNEWQHAAVASWVFNLGADRVKDSNTLAKLNRGEYQAFADALLQWNKDTVDGKKVAVKGLTNRRIKERALFLYGDWRNARSSV